MGCQPEAFLYYGFKESITNEEFTNRIQNKTLLEILNKVEVKKVTAFSWKQIQVILKWKGI